MAKIQGTLLGPKSPEPIDDPRFDEIAQVLVELLRRSEALAETIAAVALVLREAGLITLDEEESDGPTEVELAVPDDPDPFDGQVDQYR